MTINPVSTKGIYYLNFLGDFKRANRRMHNKSFTADNQITIIGGRNIADEYFELNTDSDFSDLDVIGVGPVAADVSDTFDAFWNSKRSLPIAALDVEFTTDQLESTRLELIDDFGAVHESVYADAMQNQTISDLLENRVVLYPADWEVIADDPQKLKTPVAKEQQMLANRLKEIVLAAQDEIVIISPYFVPLQSGMDFWKQIIDQGVRVVVLTNSLASTSHIAVHSGYSRYRKQLIRIGVELYEARANAVENLLLDMPEAPGNMTLHTKAIIVDRDRVFIGSLNMDPRSIDLNAEMGINIESPALAKDLAVEFFHELNDISYHVTLDSNEKLQWRGFVDGNEVIETSEPLSSRWRRFKAWFLKIVPDTQL